MIAQEKFEIESEEPQQTPEQKMCLSAIMLALHDLEWNVSLREKHIRGIPQGDLRDSILEKVEDTADAKDAKQWIFVDREGTFSLFCDVVNIDLAQLRERVIASGLI